MDSISSEFFRAIWSGVQGFAFVCTLDWSRRDKPHFTEGPAFSVASQLDELVTFAKVQVEKGLDAYFTPSLFSQPSRKQEFALPSDLVWADVDDGPIRPVKATQPTALWETSPHRYQAIWRFDEALPVGRGQYCLQRAVSHVLGCDPGGWDSTQLLRVPGSVSHKRPATWQIPPAALNSDKKALSSWLGRLARVSGRLSAPQAQMLAAAHPTGDRSAGLFSLEAALLEGGLDTASTVGLLRHSSWNKWDRLQQLVLDVRRSARRLADTAIEAGDTDDLEAELPNNDRPHLTLTPLVDLLNVPPTEWQIEGLIERGSCGFIAGPPKQYKSWLMLEMSVALASGQRALGEFGTKQAPVIIVEAEDSATRLGQRLGMVLGNRRFSAWDPRGHISLSGRHSLTWQPPRELPLHVVCPVPFGFSPDFFEDLAGLQQQVGAELICFDTLSMLTTAQLNDSNELYANVLRPLKQLAQGCKCSMMIVHHTRKPGLQGPATVGGSMLAGSVALHAWSDNSLYLTKSSEDVVEMVVESKSAALQTIALQGLDTPGRWDPQVV